jgi:hypothetical protein
MKSFLAIFAKAAVILLLLSAALTGLVRALPYDYSREDELRAILFPPGCAPPCLIGLTPDVSTREDAKVILNHYAARGWISVGTRTEIYDVTIRNTEMIWSWNADSFPFDNPVRNRMSLTFRNTIDFYNGIVKGVGISTGVSYGELRLTSGEPSDLLLAERYQSLTARYGNLQAHYVLAGVSCQPYAHAFFDWPTVLTTSSETFLASTEQRAVSQSDFARWLKTVDALVVPCV